MIDVSVVVPVYNVQDYIERCVKTLISQTYQNIEIILVNDGSTDDSLSVCEQFAKQDHRVRVLTKVNGGLSDARNYGIDHSEGRYLMFVDSDDWVELTMVEKMLQSARVHDSDVVCCDMECIYEDGRKEYSNGGSFDVMIPSECDCEYLLLPPSACNKLYKRELFDIVRYPKGMYYEDLATTPILLGHCQKISKVNEPFYKYWQRTSSIMHKETPKIFEIYQVIDRVDQLLPSQMKTSSFQKKLNKLYLLDGLYLTTLKIALFDQHRMEYYKKNMDLMMEHYPNWFSDSMVKELGMKQFVLFCLLRTRQFWLIDRLLKKS